MKALQNLRLLPTFEVDDRNSQFQGPAPPKRALPTSVSKLNGCAQDQHVVMQRLESLHVERIQNRGIEANVPADFCRYSALRESAAGLLPLLDNDQVLARYR
ncbi:MAG TPA: hypothetical protein PKE16_15010 [Hyphomicrobium sp.]|nr:hypothetical protein [Hyphomicrobium sp.]